MPGGSLGTKEIVDAIERNDTSFGTRIADRTVNRLDLPSTYTPNTERHKLTVNGTEDRDFASAAFANRPGKFQLTAADGDVVEWASRERLRYVPNYEALWGIAAWYETAADQLTSGQHLHVELSDDARENVYGYELTPGSTRTYQRSGGMTVDETLASEWDTNPYDYIGRDQPLNPRAFLTWYGVGPSRNTATFTLKDGTPRSPTLSYSHNPDDVATEEINLRLRVVAEADAGAPEFTVNVGSMGALIRGGATRFDREKAAAFYDLNAGAIGDTWAGNTPVLAKRVAPGSENVAVRIQAPEFQPDGSNTMELLVGAVLASETDAANWAPAEQSQAQNTAVEYTIDVTTFPTATRAVPGGGTVEIPDVRQMAHVISEGTKNSASKAEAAPSSELKRQLGKDEVALYIPRTAPGQTGVTIDWLRAVNKQDW